ncbi:apolipoprotein N-acyltransferase [Candidatus Kaiserbacteria bacterium RIFCSPHIGHO2_02_FULL_49_11]|uniref:Apolipoprotein N-acyltransferase n=1 Tax=Candidatus Kaiserbacteria bacterium RIFCSPHIGHO2_02_FULL_49_11 TaxID=1798489 RepID=A0A1F6D1I5_9BACT|nr:MAG: apolipoprotein N-acyltransferase [Candidatus Kaiserbacteria bacterium RIFCSPHIGHO2_02_FULL_49_11]
MGAVFLGIVYVWAWDSYPLDRFNIYNPVLAILVIFFGWSVVATVLSFFIGIWAALINRIKKRTMADLFVVSVAWIFLEYLRMWGFALLTIGKGSLLEPHFSLGFVGYILSSNQFLLQLASVGGVYALSFVLVFINAFVFWILFISNIATFRKVIVTFSAIALLFGVAGAGHLFIGQENIALEKEQEITVAVLHTSFPSFLLLSEQEKKNRLALLMDLMATVRNHGELPDIIIFPEDSRFLSTLLEEGKLDTYFANYWGGKKVLLIDSGRVENKEGEMVSRTFYYFTDTHQLSWSDKIFLVPQGEYTPYIYQLFLKSLGQEKLASSFKEYRSSSPGNSLFSEDYVGTRIGTLLCSEILSPSLYRRLVQEEDVDILVNLSSHAGFHGSRLLYAQIVNVAKVHAVANRRPFIRAGNFAPSFVIDSSGRLISESGWDGASVIYNQITKFPKGGFLP